MGPTASFDPLRGRRPSQDQVSGRVEVDDALWASSFYELLQISADYIHEVICCFGPRRVLFFLRVEDVKLDMAFDQFSHQAVQGATTRCDLLEQVGTLVLASKRCFNRFNLPPNPVDAPEKLLPVFCRVCHRLSRNLLTMVSYGIVPFCLISSGTRSNLWFLRNLNCNLWAERLIRVGLIDALLGEID